MMLIFLGLVISVCCFPVPSISLKILQLYFFLQWRKFYCAYMLHFHYQFISWQTAVGIPFPSYCEHGYASNSGVKIQTPL